MALNINNSFNYVQDYRINNIPKVDIETAKQDNAKPQNEVAKTQSISIEPIADNRSKNADIKDISLSFNKQETFGYIGKDRDVSLLDMDKAISMMRQDSALQDYQYFVGSGRDVFNSEDGRVIAKF